MKKVGGSDGVTLVELVLSMAIGFAVTAAVLGIAHKFFSIRNFAQSYSGRQIETTFALEDLETGLRNSVKISPPEDLLALNDGKYAGVAKIKAGAGPAECQNDETSHVLRLTTLRRFHRPERLYRTWRENDSAGLTGAAHEMRVSISGDTFTTTDTADLPHEIFLVDADLLSMRRYEVLGIELRKDVNLDPADDLPKLLPDGRDKLFSYVALTVGLPKRVDGVPTTKKKTSFIAQSMVYTSDTFNYCLGLADRELVRIRELKDQRMSLLSSDQGQYQIQSFAVSFGQVQKNKPVEKSDFVLTIEEISNPECMNAIRFQILMAPGKGAEEAIKDVGANALTDEIERQGSFFLQNFNLRRPASCP